MLIPLDRESPVALSRQIAGYLEELVRRGHLRAGVRLPPARALARALDLNRKTVEAAYSDLAARRLVAVRAGKGAVVRGSLPEPAELDLPFKAARARDPLPAAAWSPPGAREAAGVDLAGDGPRLRHFPPDALRRLHGTALDAGGPLFTAPPPLGEPALRRAGAAHFARCGVLRDADDVGVFRDGADALARLLDLFVPAGSTVLVDAPVDPRLLPVLERRMAGAVLLGEDLAGAEATRGAARLLLATTGCPRLPGAGPGFARRRALLDLARELGIPVAEDLTGIDRIDPPVLPPLAALDAPGRIFAWFDLDDEIGGEHRAALGAFGAKALDRLRAGTATTGAAPDRLTQRVLAAALEWPGRTRALRALRERRRLLLASVRRTIRRRLPGCGEPVFSAGGETALLPLPDGASSGEISRAAAARDLRVLDARACGQPGAVPDFLVLDLTRHEEGDLLEGIRLLGEIVDARTTGRSPTRGGARA